MEFKPTIKTKLIDAEKRLVVARGRVEEWVKWVKGSKVTSSIIKLVSHQDMMYSMVTIMGNTVLHIGKLLRGDLQSPHRKKKCFVTMFIRKKAVA